VLFATPPFLAFAILTVIATNASRKGLSNPLLYFSINAVFLALFLERVEALLLIGFTLWGYMMIRVLERRGWSTITFGIVSTLVLFVFLKKYSFLPVEFRLKNIPVIVGLSYVLFRVIHLLVDIYQEGGCAPSPTRYLNYTLSCFSLISGPFQQFSEHEASLYAERSRDPIVDLSRIANGFLKIMILAPLVLNIHLWIKSQTEGGVLLGINVHAISKLLGSGTDAAFVFGSIIGALIWMMFLYLNFSGYTDVVIGWASLCGLDLPENFNAPIRANSFLDFWNRWHMSMTNWFKTYVFTYSLKRLTARWPDRRFALFNTVTAFIVTFLLMGLWHGPNWPFAICGLLLAVGAAVNHLYKELMRRRLGSRRMDALRERSCYCMMTVGLTFTYIAVVITPFWMSNAEYLRLITNLAGPSFAIFVLVCIATGILIQTSRYIIDSLKGLRNVAKIHGLAPISASASVAVRFSVLILAILADYRSVPDFIYKGF